METQRGQGLTRKGRTPLDNGLRSRFGIREVLVVPGSEALTEFMVQKWAELSQEAVERRGYFTVALSGGTTPIDFYRSLAERKDPCPWENTYIFLADERFVPMDDPDSNYRLLREILLDKVPVPHQNVHPVRVEPSNPEQSAVEYEEDLKSFFRLSGNALPRFDLIVLGMGTDGHTASLFPANPALQEKKRLTIFVRLDEKRHHRITLTFPVINNAENIIVLARGLNKAAMVRRILEGNDLSLPVSLVLPKKGKLLFLIDREASSFLSIR
jgi:6-phosphogluconolactonase